MATSSAGVVSGITSGIFDGSTLVTSLVSAAKSPDTALQNRISALTSQISSLGGLITQVQAIGTAVTELSTTSGAQAYAATSSDATKASAAISSTAQAGNYVVQISLLATAQTSATSTFASNSAGVAGSGSLTLSTASGSPVSISFDATDTLSSIAQKINTQAGGVAQASVLYDGSNYRIVINSKSTGSAGAVQFSETGASNLGLSGASSTIVAAHDAQLSVNGIAITRSSNTVTDAVPGVTVDLAATTSAGSPVTISVGPDASAITTKVNAFVAAYNTLVKSVNAQTTYNGSQLGEDSLFGDTAVTGLRAELGSVMSSGYTTANGTTSAGLAGITLNSDGTLTVDSAKLSAAVATNPNAVSDLFVGTGTNGLASAVSDIVTRYAGDNGQLSTEKSQRNSSIQGYQDQITDIDKRATALGDVLTKQFAKLDTVQEQWATQAAYLTSLSNASNG